MLDMEPAHRSRRHCAGRAVRGRSDENIDRVLAALVHERGCRSPVEIIETTAHQGKAARAQIGNRWRKIEFAKEPGLHGVLIGGSHIEEVIAHEGSHMAVNHLLDGAIGVRGREPYQRDPAADGNHHRRCGCPSQQPMGRNPPPRLLRNMRAQTIGCRMIGNRANESTERLTLGDSTAAEGASSQMIANLPIGRGVEFAIEIGVDVAVDSLAGHSTPSTLGSAFNSSRSRSRPRAMRDITVPIGTCTTDAISLYDMPSISRRTMASRKSTGN